MPPAFFLGQNNPHSNAERVAEGAVPVIAGVRNDTDVFTRFARPVLPLAA